MTGLTATFLVGTSYTNCSHCGKNVLTSSIRHDVVPTWTGEEKGCGALFTAIKPVYFGPGMEEAVRRLRPDLPFIGVGLPEIQTESSSVAGSVKEGQQ